MFLKSEILILIFLLCHSVLGSNFKYIWQVGDFHVDFNYTIGSDPKCDEQLCCRTFDKDQKHYAGIFGYDGKSNCDIPIYTVEETLNFVKYYSENYLDGDVLSVLYTGDAPGHDMKTQTLQENYHTTHSCLDLLNEILGDYHVILTMGNHDGTKDDQLCFPDQGFECGGWVTDLYSHYISRWEDTETTSYFNSTGYYSTKIADDIKVIAMNTEFVNHNNDYVKGYSKLNHTMKNWIVNELEDSKQANEKVILFGHIPPTYSQRVFKTWNEEYVKEIINPYYDIIIFSAFAHEHINRFFLTRDSKDNPLSFGLLSPSVVTRHKHFPSAMLIEIDAGSYSVNDVYTFVNNLTASNLNGTMEKKELWIKISWSDLLDIETFDADGLYELTKRLKHDTDKIKDKFLYLYESNLKTDNSMGDKNWKKLVCKMKHTSFKTYDDCIK